MEITNKIIKYLKNLRSTQVSPSLRIPQGVQAEASFSSSRIKVPGLLTSFGRHRNATHKSHHLILPKTAHASGFTPTSASASIPAPTLALAIAVLGISFFSQTAYAASYINVSSGSGGTVSLGSIKPSATGVSASGSDTLTITTNCSAGYSVYVSAQNGGDTSLTNTNSSVTTNNTISASSTTVGSTATTLNSNTWGITGDSASASASKYVGLPSYANATNTALITASSANTSGSNTNTIYYGVKVDTTLSPGTYSGDVLYTTLVSDKCNNYTVHFDANGGSGSMSDQTIPVGTATPLTANAFSRSGYAFLGWSTSASGKTGTAINGVGTEADVDYKDGQSVTDIASFNSIINLYAIWLAVDGDMQSFSTCANLSVGESKLLRDTRDNKAYAIKKLPDGKCWMMQNLTIGSNGAQTLTANNTNIDDGKTYYLPPAGKQGSSTIDDSSTLTATDTANFTNNATTDKHAKTQFRTKGSSYGTSAKGYVNDSDTGYYNFYTATLGFAWYGTGSSGSSARDICPKGWRLPKVSATATTTSGSRDFTGDFAVLASSYNSGASWTNGTTENRYTSDSTIWDGMVTLSASPLATTTQNNYAGFSYSGNWDSMNSSAGDVGSYGYYWSSSVGDTDYGYSLGFSSSYIGPQTRSYKNYGFAVRCVAQYDYLISYSSDGSDSGEPSKTSDGAVLTSDSVTMPTQGTLTKDGYEFKGWALTSGATEATYTAEQTVTVSALIAAASSAGQTTTPGSTITLYPVWVIVIPDDGNLGTMQGYNCSSITPGHTATLTDSRDNQDYTIYRWPNTGTAGTDYPTDMSGYCIMTQDLSLGYVTGGSITKGNDLTLTTADSAAAATITARTDKSDWNTENADSNKQYINGTGGTYDAHSYYSFGAALAVCPKGWSPFTSTQRDNIVTFMGGNSQAGSEKIRGAPYSFIYGGLFYSSGWGNVGSYGDYWSSTQSSSTYGRRLSFSSGSLDSDGSSKYTGMSVRCVAEPVATMQNFSAASFSSTVGTSTQLIDSRDGKVYTVKRLPDGKVWMMQNLTIGSTGAQTLTPENTNIDDGKTYYLPPAGKQGSSTIDQSSTLTATTTANFTNNATTDKHAKTQFRTKGTSYDTSAKGYVNDSDTGYYNFYTATLGFAWYGTGSSGSSTRDICPKGWRLPKVSATATTTSGSRDFTGDFAVLASSYNSGASWTNGTTENRYTTDSTIWDGMMALSASPLATTTQNNYAGFSYSGNWLSTNSSASAVGSSGFYWSSLVYDTSFGYSLYFNSSSIYPQDNRSKNSGYAVRCVAK